MKNDKDHEPVTTGKNGSRVVRNADVWVEKKTATTKSEADSGVPDRKPKEPQTESPTKDAQDG